VSIEIEVETIEQLREALASGVDRVRLDNFSADLLREAVAANASAGSARAELEASGSITEDNLAAVAATGVDFVSIGAITKHVRAIDFSMRFS
jgi:nicotinate-nucleotide pyrophosphorylase (carboxylating)